MKLVEATERRLGKLLTEHAARVLGTIFDQTGIARPGTTEGYLTQVVSTGGREFRFPAEALHEALKKNAGKWVRVRIEVDDMDGSMI